MVTILDIAKDAGVSHGTVSNVLNNKGNVSAKKIKLVEDAARKLGYSINFKAKELRLGETNIVGIVIPDYESDEYLKLYMGLDRELKLLGYQTQLYASYSSVDQEKKIVKELAESRCIAVFTVSVLSDAQYYYKALSIGWDRIVFINRKPQNAKCYASFDYIKAGEEIGEHVKAFGNIGVFLNNEKNENQKDFLNGLKSVISNKNTFIFNSSFYDSVRVSYDIVKNTNYKCIITNNIYNAKMLRRAYCYGSFQEIPKIIALSTDNHIKDDKIEIYQLNYYALGRTIASNMIDSIEGVKEYNVTRIFENDGFENADIKMQEKSNLRILTVRTPTTDALKKIKAHFKKLTNISVEIDSFSQDRIYEILSGEEAFKYDIIRMDMAIFPWFAEKIFRPISGLDEKIDRVIDELSETKRYNYVDYKKTAYMIPFDPSVEMLFYRKDIFDNPLVQRLYFEKTKMQLRVPESLEELVNVSEFFMEESGRNIPVERGISINTKSINIIASQILTFYYSLGGKVDFSPGGELFDKKIAVKTFELYNRLYKCAMYDEGDWWENSVQLYSQGKTAMVISFSNHLSKISSERIAVVTGYKSTPGNHPMLGGGVLGIVNTSNKFREAAQFISWFNTKDIAREIVHLGGYSANKKIYEEKDIHNHYPWLSQADYISQIGHRDYKTEDGDPVNLSEIKKIMGSIIKDNIYELEKCEKIFDEINAALKKINYLKQ